MIGQTNGILKRIYWKPVYILSLDLTLVRQVYEVIVSGKKARQSMEICIHYVIYLRLISNWLSILHLFQCVCYLVDMNVFYNAGASSFGSQAHGSKAMNVLCVIQRRDKCFICLQEHTPQILSLMIHSDCLVFNDTQRLFSLDYTTTATRAIPLFQQC